MKALFNSSRVEESIKILKEALTIDPSNKELQLLLDEYLEEVKDYKTFPKDHPERFKFKNLENWLKKDPKTDLSKIKMKFYAENQRGVHASCNISEGDQVCFIPESYFITTDMTWGFPIG